MLVTTSKTKLLGVATLLGVSMVALLFLAVPSPSAHAAVGGGGTGGGGGGGSGPYTWKGYGWFKFGINSAGPRDFQNGNSWGGVQAACRAENARSVVMYVVQRDTGGPYNARVYDDIGWSEGWTGFLGNSGGDWTNRAGAAAMFNTLPASQRVGYSIGSNVGWFCYDHEPIINFSTSGTTTINQTSAKPGDRIVWTHSLTNNGPTQSTAIYSQTVNSGFSNGSFNGTKNGTTGAMGVRATRTHPSYSTYDITQGDVGNTLCQQLQWDPTNSSGGRHGRAADRCVSVPYSYSLIPTITNLASNTVIESDSKTINVVGRVVNTGLTKSRPNVNWQLTQLRYAPGVTSIPRVTGGTGTDPCGYFTGESACTPIGSSTVASGYSHLGSATYNASGQLSNEAAGTKICYAMSVRPYNQSTGDWRHSQLYCLIIGKKPKVQVWGGSVSVGKTLSGTPYNTSSDVMTSLTTKEEVSITEVAPADAITGLWKTGVNSSDTKLGENVSDPHWSIDRIYRPSGSLATCQRGYNSAGAFATIPTSASSNFQARTIREIAPNVNAGQYITDASNGVTGNRPNTGADSNGPVWSRASTNARWIGQNLYGQNYSSTGCTDPTGVGGPYVGDMNFANIYAFKQRQSIRVANTVNLNSIRLTIRGAVDNDVKFYVNGCELRATTATVSGTNWQRPGWTPSSTAGAEAYVVGGASGCSTGSTGFRHGDNTFEVHVRSTYSHTGLLIDQFTATATVTRPAANVYGSWAEYGIFAPGSVNLMASASGLNEGGTTSVQSNWSNFTFTKTSSGGYGQYTAANQTLPDVTTSFPNASAIVESNWNLSAIAKGRNIKPAAAVSNITLTANAGSTLGSGQWLVVNAIGKNVTIASNLTYANGPFTSARNIPQLIIIANNITINSNVTRVDAWLVARNAISTCEQQVNGSGTAQWLSAGTNYASSNARLVIGPGGQCTNPLRMNGPIIASKLYLRRTAGSGTTTAAGDPAEVINLRPDAYLWANEWMNPLRPYQTATLTELPPRY